MRTLLTVILLFASLCSFTQYRFSLTGTTPDGFNNKKVYLIVKDSYSNQRYKFTDSTIVSNNRFVFNGTINKISESANLYTEAKEITGFVDFVVDSGINTMVIRPLPPKWPLYKNKLSNTELLNSQSNVIKKALNSLTDEYHRTKGKPSTKNKNVIELDTATRTQLRRKQLELLKQNPNVFYTIVHLYSQLKTSRGFKTDEAAELYEALSTELQSSVLGTEIQAIIASDRSTKISHPVSLFTIQTDKGDSFSNSSLEDTVYLIAFGATWCGPCKERIPMLNQLYEKYSRNGFRIVYVNLDEKTPLWKQQIDKYKMHKFINVSEGVKWGDSEMAKRFNVSAIPYYLLISKEGKIVYNPFQLVDYEYQQLEKAIKSNLK